MLAAVNNGLDRAEKDDAVAVVLAGRPGRFSAFDLRVLRAGGPDAEEMVRTGFEFAAHAIAPPLSPRSARASNSRFSTSHQSDRWALRGAETA